MHYFMELNYWHWQCSEREREREREWEWEWESVCFHLKKAERVMDESVKGSVNFFWPNTTLSNPTTFCKTYSLLLSLSFPLHIRQNYDSLSSLLILFSSLNALIVLSLSLPIYAGNRTAYRRPFQASLPLFSPIFSATLSPTESPNYFIFSLFFLIIWGTRTV